MTSLPPAMSRFAMASTLNALSTPTEDAKSLNATIGRRHHSKCLVRVPLGRLRSTRMADRADQLIRDLGLQPHPEGGHYAEVHRSPAVTAIYFLLRGEEISRWHRVRSDEIWHHYEGAPLDLLQLSPDGIDLELILLGPLAERQQPVHCVPVNYWQAARSRGAFTLAGCTVAPAFRFADFALLKDHGRLAAEISRIHPAAAQFV